MNIEDFRNQCLLVKGSAESLSLQICNNIKIYSYNIYQKREPGAFRTLF